MLTGINLFSTKINTKKIETHKQAPTQSLSLNENYALPSSIMFAGRLNGIPSKYQVEFGVEFDKNQRRAEKVEEEGLFFSAKKQYKQNFKKLVKYIEQESKKGPITDLKIAKDLTRVTSCLCSNLGALCEVSLAKKYAAQSLQLALEKFDYSIITPEEKHLDLLVKIDEDLNPNAYADDDADLDVADLSGYIEDTEDPSVNLSQEENPEINFNENDDPEDALQEADFDKIMNNSNDEAEESQVDSEDEGWIDMGNVYIRKVLDKDGKEQFFTDVVPNMQFKDTIVYVPPAELANMLKEQKDIIEKIAPDKVSRKLNEFNPVLEEAIDKYQDLSLFLAGTQLKDRNIKQAKETIDGIEQFLMQKDPTKIYWDEDEILQKHLEVKELGEITPVEEAEEESIETIEANIGARDLSNPDMLRIECLQTLAKEKSFSTLANISLSNIDKLATKYSIQLLVNAKDEKAQKMLQKVLTNLPEGQEKEELLKKLGKSKGDISFTGFINNGYDFIKVDSQLERAKKIEESGYFFDAGKLYKKAWNYTFDYIKTKEKNDNPIDPAVLTFFRNSTDLLCQNLCARGKIDTASVYANVAYEKLNDNIIIDETKNDAENVLNAKKLKASQKMKETLSNGDPVYREIDFNGEKKLLINLVDDLQQYKDEMGPSNEVVYDNSFEGVTEIRESFKAMVDAYVEGSINPENYDPEVAFTIENFADVSATAINMLRKSGSNVKNSKANELLLDSVNFLKEKDPDNVYWEKEQFDFIRASLNETEKATFEDVSKGYPEDFEMIEAFLGAKDTTLKPAMRVDFMEKLVKAKAYEKLAQISLANIDKYSNTAPIHLLSKAEQPEARNYLQKIMLEHVSEDVRKAATEKFNQQYYKL